MLMAFYCCGWRKWVGGSTLNMPLASWWKYFCQRNLWVNSGFSLSLITLTILVSRGEFFLPRTIQPNSLWRDLLFASCQPWLCEFIYLIFIWEVRLYQAAKQHLNRHLLFASCQPWLCKYTVYRMILFDWGEIIPSRQINFSQIGW